MRSEKVKTMLCQKCHKNQATVHIKNSINGEVTEMALCRECAEQENLNSFFQFPSDKLFSGFFSDSIFGAEPLPKSKSCPVCGCTRADLASGGKPGCAKCYEVFSDELARIIRGIHGNTLHSGSRPGKHMEQIERNQKLESLKKELQQSIEEQNFEKAAELRDIIKALENEEKGE